MIRRAAALVGTGAPGFVLAVLIKVADSGNETATVIFEDKATGTMAEKACNEVKYSDGSPDTLTELP